MKPALAILALATAACVQQPMTVEQAMVACVDRARAAAAPTGSLTVGANSNSGPFAGLSLGVSSDLLAGRSPDETFAICVAQKSGRNPTRPLSDFL